MRLKAKILRAVKIGVEHLRAAADYPAGATNSQIEEKVKEKYGPMAIRFKIYWTKDAAYPFAIAGIEVMAFEILKAQVPQGGIITCDPLSQVEILRADGSLEGELARIGIPVDHRSIEWRLVYETDNEFNEREDPDDGGPPLQPA
jgi:hypothetical protein